jgi:hypothetical protein
MVTCNVDRFLAESIESVLCQTFSDFKFIIVDFGSTDKSKSIISSYAAMDSRIRFHEIPNCGLGEARNAACALATGQYVAIMDADDIAVAERLEWQVEFMEKHLEVGLVGGAAELIDATAQPLCTNSFPSEDSEIQSALAVQCSFYQPAVLMRRDALIRVGSYRAAFGQSEDYDLWLRIAEHFRCANLKQVVLRYRIHPRQVSLQNRREQTVCKLAAQVSASRRRSGNPDPLDSVKEITCETLTALGVTEATKQRNLVSDCRRWIRHMCMAGEYSVALGTALEFLHEDWKSVERWQIADLHLTIASIHWKQRKLLKSFIAAGHAVMTRPAVIGRPLRPLLRRLGLAIPWRPSEPPDSRLND